MSRYLLADRPYETLFICPPETPQATIDGLVEKIKAIISKENGTFKSVQVWGRRRMTFPIKRHKDGLYIYIDFNGAAVIPNALNSLYRVNDFVLRHMTLEREDAPPAPAAPATPVAAAAGTAEESTEKAPVNS